MELSYSELSKRDVINVADGRCLGRIIDLTLSFPRGVLTGITVPGRRNRGLFSFFDKSRIFIEVNKIIKIGGDVILVDLRCADTCAPNVKVGEKGKRIEQPPNHCPPNHYSSNCCPPKPLQNDLETLDLSSLADQNGRIDLSDY